MPSGRATWVLSLLAAQVVLLLATLRVPGLGEATWHHGASLGLTLVVTAFLWKPLLHERRFLAMGILAFTVLATASGFWLLYWKEGLRADGLQDWGRFWHILWSWFAAVLFFQHTGVNIVAFLHFLKRSVSTLPAALLHAGAYVVVAGAFLLTWSTWGRGWFTNGNYIELTLYAWLAFTVPPYLVWVYVRARARAASPPAWIARVFPSQRVRGWVDVWLVPMATLAVVSGVPLTFMKPIVEADGLKYVVKYWHVWPSVAFAMLVFVHAIHSWAAVRAHWRSYDADAAKAAALDANAAHEEPPA